MHLAMHNFVAGWTIMARLRFILIRSFFILWRFFMKIYEELQARGLIAQVTDEPEIRELINKGGARFYIGFDPTAD